MGIDPVPPPEWCSGIHEPRASVRGLIIQNDRLLAVENHRAGPGKLHLPGGGIEHGETMLATLRRELAEELGVGIRDARYVLVIENLFDTPFGRYHVLEHLFHVEAAGVPRQMEAHLSFHWLPMREIEAHAFYPKALRDILAQPDWMQRRLLQAGLFAGGD